MYSVFLDGMLLPTAPSKIETKINNKNKTVNLINDSEINILKKADLTDIKFDMRIFHKPNPYTRELMSVEYYLNFLEILKQTKKSFQFITYRTWDNNERLYDSNMTVSLEDYNIDEDSSDGTMTTIKIQLKQYADYDEVEGEIEETDEGKVIKLKKNRYSDKEIPSSKKANRGDTLWDIAKRELGDGSKYKELAEINNMTNPNGILNGGEVIKLD